MGVFTIIAAIIAVGTTAASYMQAKKAQKMAAKQAEEMAAVQLSGHDSNRSLYTVYGEALVGSTTIWKKISGRRVPLSLSNFVIKSKATGADLTSTYSKGAKRYFYRVVTLCNGPVEDITNILIDGEGYLSPRFGYEHNFHFGSAISKGPTTGQHYSRLADYSEFYQWDSTKTGKGVAYAVERLYLDKKKPAFQGEPSTQYLVKGRLLYDPRLDSTVTGGSGSHRQDAPSTWVWTDNPAICLLDYITNTEYGRGLAYSTVDLTAIMTAANACDVLVDVPSRLVNDEDAEMTVANIMGGQYTVSVAVGDTIPVYRENQAANNKQKRYRINAAIDGAKEVLDNIQQILNVFKANLVYVNGKYTVIMADVASSVLSLGDDDIIGGLDISDGDRAQRMNRATIKFTNANKNFKTDQVSWPEIGSTAYNAYLAEDQGEKIHRTFTIDGCTDFYQAEDTAEFIVRDGRTGLTVRGNFGSRALALVPGDVVALTYDSASYSGKYFRVQTVALNLQTMNVALSLREYDSSVYTWNASRGNEPLGLNWDTEPVNLAPTSPTIGVVVTTVVNEADGSAISVMEVPFSGVPDEASVVEVSWSVQSAHNYNTISITDLENETSAKFPVGLSGVTYDVRLRYVLVAVNGTALPSAYVYTTHAVPALSSPIGTKVAGVDEGATATVIYRQADAPSGTAHSTGDQWFDTDNGNKHYVWAGNTWASVQDTAIATAQQEAEVKYASFFRYTRTSGTSVAAPSDEDFETQFDRAPIEHDQLVVTNTATTPDTQAAYVRGSSAWGDAVNNFLSGDLIVDGSIGAEQITVNSLSAISANMGTITTGNLHGGDVAGITINATKMFTGTGTFNNANTGFYLDSSGKFSLKDSLFFNPTNEKLTVAGNITADSITVNDDLVVLGNLQATSVSSGGITRDMLSQDALDSIYGALATSVGGSNGAFKTGEGSFTRALGGSKVLGTSSDLFEHGTADIDVEFRFNNFFYSTTNVAAGSGRQFTITYEVSTDGSTYTDAKTQVLEMFQYDLSSYYGYAYYVYHLNTTDTKTFTSGATQDVADSTDLYIKVSVTSVGSAFQAADDISQPMVFTFEANELVTGVTSTGGNADTLDNLDSTKFLRSDIVNTNITLSGYLRGPSTFTIDPAAHDDNTGTVVIAGNLQVDGTTTTINSTVVDIDDLNITVAGNATTNAEANNGGLTVGGSGAELKYLSSGDKWTINKALDVSGKLTTNTGIEVFYNDHASGPVWDTFVHIGKVDDASSHGDVGPVYQPDGSYGMLAIANSDGMFVGLEQTTTGNYNPVIKWGDDHTSGEDLFFRHADDTYVAKMTHNSFTVDGTISATDGDSTNWNAAYGWGNHATAGYLTSYTDTNTTYSAGTGVTLTGTTFSLTDTNAKLNLTGGTLTGDLSLQGNLLLTGDATATNAARTIDFTGFDKEDTTDLSDRAYIQHTTNTGGHAGSVLVISSQNDSGDGIAFETHSSSQLKHNSNTIWTAGTDGSGSGLDADTLDGYQSGYFATQGNLGAYLQKAGGTLTGALSGTTATFTSDSNALTIRTESDGEGAEIRFSDQISATPQFGYLTYFHSDTASYGSGNSFIFGSSETTTTILADGKLMYGEGLYLKPATGTGAGTRKDLNWDTAYGWGDHASAGYLTSYTDTNTTYAAGTGVTLTGTTFSLTDTNAKLNLSGGTLTGDLTMGNNVIYGDLSTTALRVGSQGYFASVRNIEIRADDDDSSDTEYLLLSAGQNKLKITSTSSAGTDNNKLTYNGNKVWNAGNDGSGSGLDADTLDGYQSGYFATQGNLGAYLQKAGGTMTGKLTLPDAGYSLGDEYHKWKSSYVVTASTPQELLYSDGNSLPDGGVYRFTAHISGTGTDQFATAVYWNQNGTWRINVTGQSGTSSNHPEFIIDATTNKPTIHIDHSSGYTVHILAERIELTEGTGTDNAGFAFGTDAFLGSVDNNLYFLPNGTTATGPNSYDDGNAVWHSGNLTTTNKSNYDTAHGWGDHSTAGYLTSYTDTNTTYSIQDGELSQNNFTNADHTKLDGIAASANNYSLANLNAHLTGGVGNIVTSGYIRGPADMVIDPAAHGDDTGTVTIAGNLTVSGTTTTIDSNTISLGDNLIVFNGDLAANQAPTETTGFTVNRGNEQNVSLHWNEASDKWTMSDASGVAPYNYAILNVKNFESEITILDGGTF